MGVIVMKQSPEIAFEKERKEFEERIEQDRKESKLRLQQEKEAFQVKLQQEQQVREALECHMNDVLAQERKACQAETEQNNHISQQRLDAEWQWLREERQERRQEHNREWEERRQEHQELQEAREAAQQLLSQCPRCPFFNCRCNAGIVVLS